jgi:transcriptional regulator with XRE-family HTH domain
MASKRRNIIGIGPTAGGLKALDALVGQLSANLPVSILMSKLEVFDRCDANTIRHALALLAKRLRAAREKQSPRPQDLAEQAGISKQQVHRMERSESNMAVLALALVAQVLEKDLDWFVSDVRKLKERTERLWRNNENVTRAYPADLRLPAKKEILIGLGLWEPVAPARAERYG